MKLAIITLSTIAAASSLLQPAMAQNARFDFAPNTWASEPPNKPRHMYTNNGPYVPAGHVPQNMLGMDPGFISKPAPVAAPPSLLRQVMPALAPIAQKTVQATPTFTAAVPKVLPPAFQAKFGNPLSAGPAIAMQPNKPQAPIGQSAPAKSDAAKPSSKPVHHYGRSLSGHIVPHVQTGQAAPPAKGLPPVATYNNVGYQQGAYLPSIGGGSGSGANSSLSGRILTPQRHHH